MTPRVAILADDLSGANSVGAEFARTGLVTFVTRALELDAALKRHTDVLVISTDTRNRTAEEATALLRAIVPRVTAAAPGILVKKIDSLLRGPIAAEAEALMTASRAQTALVIAASPENGRTTVGGRQRVRGRPLHEATASLDPGAVLSSDDVCTIFEGCGLPVRLLDLRAVRGAAGDCHGWTGSITVADCESQQDIAIAVRTAYAAGVRCFFGTYGVGEALALLLAPRTEKPLLLIAGSLSEATRDQVLALREDAGCAVLSVECPSSSWKARDALERGLDVALFARPDTLGDTFRKLDGPPTRMVASAMEQAIASLTLPLLSSVSGLVVSGGSTVDALLERMGAQGLQLTDRELLPGVPLARVCGGTWDGLWCITKPGSFGNRDALQFLRRSLHEWQRGCH